jgi:hypothetical protein
MNPLRTRLRTRLATLTATALLATTSALARQETPSPTAISSQRIAELAAKRAELSKLKEQLSVPRTQGGSGGGGIAVDGTVVSAASALEADLRAASESRQATLQVYADSKLLEAASQIGLFRQYKPFEPSRQYSESTLLEHFTNQIRYELRTRGSGVDIWFDQPLAMFSIKGSQWEVLEAKELMTELLPTYLHRIEEMRANERTQSGRQIAAETITLDWTGGELGVLVQHVNDQVVSNVVLSDPALANIAVPPLSVQRMTPEVFFKMLETLPRTDGNDFVVTVVNDATIQPESKATAKVPGSIAAITISPALETMKPPVKRIFDLRPAATADEQMSLIDSISFTMGAAEYTSEVKVRFHEPSKLLFVQGPRAAVELVAEVLRARMSK